MLLVAKNWKNLAFPHAPLQYDVRALLQHSSCGNGACTHTLVLPLALAIREFSLRRRRSSPAFDICPNVATRGPIEALRLRRSST